MNGFSSLAGGPLVLISFFFGSRKDIGPVFVESRKALVGEGERDIAPQLRPAVL